MKPYQILKDGNPILKKVAEPVDKFDNELGLVIARMQITMSRAGGIGLAAPQVGISKRIFVMNLGKNSFPMVFINPEIISASHETGRDWEGCLSFPNKKYLIDRSIWVVIKYQNSVGQVKEQRFTGLSAVCVQHEIDHLQGITFDVKANNG